MPLRRNILVVDDNLLNRKILRKILMSDGYSVVEAENGQEALHILKDRTQSVKLVLLDLEMPIIDGYSVLKEMNESGIIASIPVIVTTGNENAEIRCLENGASDFLKKPYNAELVRHRVESLLRLWENAALLNQLETDQLTGVLSKEFFYRYTQQMLDENPDDTFYIVYSDIDDFKMINAQYGTSVGDDVLKTLADIFKAHAFNNGLCGRLGSDNFVMFLRSLPDYTQEQVGRFFTEEFKDSPIKGIQFKCGIYAVTDRDRPVSNMCDRAKLALTSIKHRYGVYYAVYDNSLQKKAMRDHQLADSMEESLEKKQFLVYFQPKHYTDTRAVAGAEALVRWQHPELGLLQPGEFIPLFEQNGFITKLDRYMLCAVCEIIQKWIEDGIRPIPVSVNISRADFKEDNLPKKIETIVDSYSLPHELIHLEITESAYTDHPQEIIAAVTALRKMGFLIEMDDFGSGYSSLNMLSELPINILKLDIRFIQSGNKRADGQKQNILSFILSLSKWLQFPTIAEGVETEEEFLMLKTMGCNMVQGYYFSKPMPAEAFSAYMLAHPGDSSLAVKKETVSFAAEMAIPANDSDKPHVLIAEDIESNRELMKELLMPYYSVATAANGKEACEYIQTHSKELSCILLDLLMPVMDGFQVLEMMQQTDLIHEIPIIITTETGSGNEVRALHLGADSFVAKPYQPEILIHHVKKAVEEKGFWQMKREMDRKDSAQNKAAEKTAEGE